MMSIQQSNHLGDADPCLAQAVWVSFGSILYERARRLIITLAVCRTPTPAVLYLVAGCVVQTNAKNYTIRES